MRYMRMQTPSPPTNSSLLLLRLLLYYTTTTLHIKRIYVGAFLVSAARARGITLQNIWWVGGSGNKWSIVAFVTRPKAYELRCIINPRIPYVLCLFIHAPFHQIAGQQDSSTSQQYLNSLLTAIPFGLSSTSNGSLSDSGISDGGASGSDYGLSERERRLSALRRLARQLENALAPGSAALLSIAQRMEAAEADLRSLQDTCRQLIVRTAASQMQQKQEQQQQQQNEMQQQLLQQQPPNGGAANVDDAAGNDDVAEKALSIQGRKSAKSKRSPQRYVIFYIRHKHVFKRSVCPVPFKNSNRLQFIIRLVLSVWQ